MSVGKRVSPWLKLQQGKPLDTTFDGSAQAISALRNNLAEPTAQVAADINADGYADLIGGFRNAEGGGLIALHRASRQAFEPTDEQVLADLRRGVFPASFDREALILDTPTAPDFIVAGKFSRDSAVDLVFASRGGRSIYLMTSDGKGGFNAPWEIPVEGEITALASEKIDFSQAYAGVVAAVSNDKSSNLLVFNGKAELVKTTPQSIAVERQVDSMILARSDFADGSVDLFGLADGGMFTIYNIGNTKGEVNPIELPFRAVDFAVGEFISDRRGKTEIAVLSENGTVSYLAHGTLDTRPYTNAEMREFNRREGRGNSSIIKPEADNAAEGWTEAEAHQLGFNTAQKNPARILRKAYITGNETEDLLVTDSSNNRVQILFKEPHTNKNRASLTGETKSQTVAFADAPVAILPMRLNVMGQQGFVVFGNGSLEPIPVMAGPNATFTVTKTADTNDGACTVADCSLREAVVAANNLAGADMIVFTPNGTFQLTIAGANENASATGDLDVLQALTVMGNGTGNTIITAGTNTTNGIDKIFSVNPLFNAAFASSFTGMTMRFGRNPSPFNGDGYGGALDWDGTTTGMGTISISNTIVDQNTATDGRGGGLVFTTGAGGSGVTLTNTNVTGNTASRTVPSNGTAGGGIFVGGGTPFSLTTGSISNNQTTGTNNNGGGLFIFAVVSGLSGNSNLSGVTISNNTTQDRGGGVFTERGLTFTGPTIISNNSTGINGGGLSMNVFASSVNISKATLVGNSSGTSGGAIDVGSQTGANGNILNMSFSRIVGNTGGGFTGLVTRGGTANVENNWWGCNTGPGTTGCDSVGMSGGGSFDFDPWLRFTHAASPSTIVVGQGSTLTASFLTNSNNQAIAASNLDALVGVPITFNMPVRGTISGAQATIQSTGTATATFTGTSVGAGSANATVDNGTVTANLTIGVASTTTTINTDNPDPSNVGQTVTVTYTVAPQFGGTPTGTVTVSDGVDSCMASVAAGQCSLALTTVGARTLTATYVSGDTNFTGSMDTEPHQVNASNPNVSVQDARVAEPTSGMTPMVFTVSLSAPATSAVSVDYATANGGANPATGGASCGGSVDYITTSGAVSFTSGQQVKTISVDVCADTNMAETDETFLVNLSNPSGATITDGQAVGTITVANPAGATLISELRHFGPGMANNPNDEFVEIYNNTDAPLTVPAGGYGLFKMGATCADTPVLIGTIPAMTMIPARGHYLFVGTAYSLADYGGTGAAAGNATLTSEIEANRNVGLFSTTDVTQISSVNRLDAVGFGANTGGVCDLLREGSTQPALTGSPMPLASLGQHSYFRKLCDFVSGVGCSTPGQPKDTNANAADFQFADTEGMNAGAGQRLGAPGPENLASPRRVPDANFPLGLLDNTKAPSAVPNRMRDLSMTDPVTSSFGTLSIRRRVDNNTGGTVTRLRFRIVELTTFPTPPGTADLRAITSMAVMVGPVGDGGTCGAMPTPCMVTVQGTTLETPPAQPNGGGLNATYSATLPGGGLPNGQSLNLQFLLGVQQTGTFRFLLIVEALP